MKKLILILLFISNIAAYAQSKIYGTWLNTELGFDMYLKLNSDGNGELEGDPIQFKIRENTIDITQDGGTEIYQYSLQGNVLIISGGNLEQTLKFNRVVPGNGKPIANNNPSSKTDLSIVGKWCYVNVTSTNSGGTSTNECIIIREDGTYSYYSERSMSASNGGTASQSSDSGKWWIEGNRIHYSSATQGQGSYQLEKRNHPKTGDPMIVLDGTSYVTFYNKASW